MIEEIRNSKAHVFVEELSGRIEIVEQDYFHLAKSLRLKVGERISAAHNRTLRLYEISEVTKDKIEAISLNGEFFVKENTVEMYVSLFKIDKLEIGISKAVETGATKITIGTTNRSSVKIESKKKEKLKLRFEQIIKSSAMQSRRVQIPKIEFSSNLIEDFKNTDHSKYLCEPSGVEKQMSSPCSIMIGPEGGFDKDEINELQQYTEFIKLSEYILRAETAMTVAPLRAS